MTLQAVVGARCVYQERFLEGTVVSRPQLPEGILNQMISS